MKSLRWLFIVYIAKVKCSNPVFNVADSLNPEAPILDLAPKLTTSFDEVQMNDHTRLITLGEAHVDPEKHLQFSPVHQYEEDPEFVTAASQIRKGILNIKDPVTPYDDSVIKGKMAQVAQDIYAFYGLKTEADKAFFLKGDSSPIKPFMEAINRVDNNLTKEEEDIYDKVRDLVKEMRRVWDGIKADPVNGPAFFEQVKALTVLVDQKELMERQLTNLDTPIFDMTRTIDELDHPLAHYAERMKHWILRGPDFDDVAFQDLETFLYFAQRKAKLMKIYRRVSIIRVKAMIGDLDTQVNAVIHLQEEWAQELRDANDMLAPLQKLQNKMAASITHNITAKRAIMADCVESMDRYPAIQALCIRTVHEDDLHMERAYAKFIVGIKQEFLFYEKSMQNIITQFQLIRAAQDAITDPDQGSGPAVKQLLRLGVEVNTNQKYIRMNNKINELTLIVAQFRRKSCTQDLALQNLDNIIQEAMWDNFESVGEAVAKESESFLAVYNQKRTAERQLEIRLMTVAGKLVTEYSSETSHEAEELMEWVFQFRQKTTKLARITRLLTRKDFDTIRRYLIDELQFLKKKEFHFEQLLKKARNLLVNCMVIPFNSAKVQVESLENDIELRAHPRLHFKMVQNYFLVEDRVAAMQKLQSGISKLEVDFEDIIMSQAQVNQQFEWIETYEHHQDEHLGLEAKEKFKINVEMLQGTVIFDQRMENFQRNLKLLLRDAKAEDVLQKIRDLLEYGDSFDFRLSVLTEDNQAHFDQIELDFIDNNFDGINKHMGEAYNELQRSEKEADMLYTVRRVMHLSITDDIEGAKKILNNMMLSLDKEYFSLTSQVKELKDFQALLEKLKAEGDSHLSFTAILSDVKQVALMGYQSFFLLQNAQHHSASNDQIGAKKMLDECIDYLRHDINDWQLSADNVEKQRQFLEPFLKNSDKKIFVQIDTFLDIYRSQVKVLTDDVLSQLHQDFWAAVMNHKNQESIDIQRKIRDKVGAYVDQLWDKITHIDVQVDHVDVAVNDLVEKAKRVEGTMRMAKSQTENNDDLAEKIRQHLQKSKTMSLNQRQPQVQQKVMKSAPRAQQRSNIITRR